MSRHQIEGKKGRENENRRIRSGCPGGGELLDLLNLVSSMRGRSRGETADVLRVIENRLQLIRRDMAESVQTRPRPVVPEAPPEPEISPASPPEKKPLPPIRAETPVFAGEAGEEWTTAELAILEQHYNQGRGVNRCVDLLPGRNRGGIIEMARKSGFATSKARYTAAEIEAIKSGNYDQVPGRTVAALKTKRSRLLNNDDQ